MSLEKFCSWLQQTWLSQILQGQSDATNWIVPAIQTIHILAIAVALSSMLIVTLRQLRILATEQPLAAVGARFLRVVWWALPLLALTGSLLIIAEPMRSLGSAAFQLKMALLAVGGTLTWIYHSVLARAPLRWERLASRPLGANVLAVVCLLIWISIIFAGRWIAYAPGQ